MEQELEVILLGVIQGLTEWLPISSTGHIELAEIFLGLTLPLSFDVALHLGTLVVTAIFFRADLKKILVALMGLDFKSWGGIMLKRIIASSIPTAIIGLSVAKILEVSFREVIPLAVAFIISGLTVYLSKIGRNVKSYVDYKSAIIIGIAQGFSIVPGLSRSGLTIAVALLLGIKREEAFKFSFLLSIPAVLGALVVTLYAQYDVLLAAGVGWADLFGGVLVSMLLGYASLKLLRRALHNFHVFAFYSLSLGLFLIAASALI